MASEEAGKIEIVNRNEQEEPHGSRKNNTEDVQIEQENKTEKNNTEDFQMEAEKKTEKNNTEYVQMEAENKTGQDVTEDVQIESEKKSGKDNAEDVQAEPENKTLQDSTKDVQTEPENKTGQDNTEDVHTEPEKKIGKDKTEVVQIEPKNKTQNKPHSTSEKTEILTGSVDESKSKEVETADVKVSSETNEERMKQMKEEEAKQIQDEEAKQLRDEEVKQMKDEEVKQMKVEEVKQTKDEEAKQLKEEEAKQIKDEEAKQLKDEEAKQTKYEEAKQTKDDEAKQKKVEEAKQKIVEEAKEIKDKEAKEIKDEEAKQKKVEEAKEIKDEEIKDISQLDTVENKSELTESMSKDAILFSNQTNIDSQVYKNTECRQVNDELKQMDSVKSIGKDIDPVLSHPCQREVIKNTESVVRADQESVDIVEQKSVDVVKQKSDNEESLLEEQVEKESRGSSELIYKQKQDDYIEEKTSNIETEISQLDENNEIPADSTDGRKSEDLEEQKMEIDQASDQIDDGDISESGPLTPMSNNPLLDTPGPSTPISFLNNNDSNLGPPTPASSIMDNGSTSVGPTPTKRSRLGSTSSGATTDVVGGHHHLPAAKLFEYQWPPDSSGEYYMLQEQISEYLGVKSFKRKYPDLQRRVVDMKERDFLREKGVVTETQCDLGLTAIRTEDVYDLMGKDYPEKWREYSQVLHDRQRQTIKEKHKEYGVDMERFLRQLI